MYHTLTPHGKEGPPDAALATARAESALSIFLSFLLRSSKIHVNASSLQDGF